MNIEDAIKEKLIENGMFESQADEVLSIAKDEELLGDMKGRWGDDVRDYPAFMMPVIWLSVKSVAAEWIEKNAPEAWFKPIFAVA